MAVVKHIRGKIEANRIISGKHGVVVIFVAGFAAEHHLPVVVAETKGTVIVRRLELDRTALRVEHRRRATLHPKNLRTSTRRDQCDRN